MLLLRYMLVLMLVASCTKQDLGTPDQFTTVIDETGRQVTDRHETFSNWTIGLPIAGSGSEKVILTHTQALRTMARSGNVSPLREEMRERGYETSTGGDRLPNDTSIDPHESDINNVGFASELQVEHYLIAMFHFDNYPDHFIVINLNDNSWTRYAEGNHPMIYLQSS